MPLRNRNGTWHYRFQVDGVPYSGETGLAATDRNKNAAARLELKARELVEQGKSHLLKLKSIPFERAAVQYLAWAEGEHRDKPKTYEAKRSCMAALRAFFRQALVHTITPGQLEDFKSWRRREHEVREVTIRHGLHTLSDFFQYAKRQGWCTENPVREIEVPSDQDAVREHVFTDEEEDVYFAKLRELMAESPVLHRQEGSVRRNGPSWSGSFNCWQEDGTHPRRQVTLGSVRDLTEADARAKLATVIQASSFEYRASPEWLNQHFGKRTTWQALYDFGRILIQHGCRPEEVLALRVEHVDLVAGRFRIVSGKSKAARRTLKLTAETREIFTGRIAMVGSGYLFPGKQGGHLQKLNAPHNELLDLLAADGYRLTAVPYDFRHTAATRWIRAGIPVTSVAALLGHANLRTVMRYVHLAQEDKDDAMDKYDQVLAAKRGKQMAKKMPVSGPVSGPVESNEQGRLGIVRDSENKRRKVSGNA